MILGKSDPGNFDFGEVKFLGSLFTGNFGFMDLEILGNFLLGIFGFHILNFGDFYNVISDHQFLNFMDA